MVDLKNDSDIQIFNLTVDEIWSEFMTLVNFPPFGLLRCAAIHIPVKEEANYNTDVSVTILIYLHT